MKNKSIIKNIVDKIKKDDEPIELTSNNPENINWIKRNVDDKIDDEESKTQKECYT